MRSIRTRIILWHLLGGLTVAALASGLTVWMLQAIIARNTYQTVALVARGVPELVAAYRRRHYTFDEMTRAIDRHFAEIGIIAIMVPSPPGSLRPPPLGLPPFGQVRVAVPMIRGIENRAFVRATSLDLLFTDPRPVIVKIPDGFVLLHPDPTRLHWLVVYVPLVVVGVFVCVLGAAWFAGATTARRVLEPLIRTTRALDRFGDNDFVDEPVTTNDRSEIGDLARSYNRAVAAVTRAFAERDRTESEMRQFVGDAGHQLRTPLTVIMGHLSAQTLHAQDSRDTMVLENMLVESRRMRALIEDLIILAKLEYPAPGNEFIDLRELVARLIESYEDDMPRRVQLVAAADGIIPGRESEMYGALRALADNALKYGKGSPVEIELRRNGDMLDLTVTDRGPGMSDDDLEHAFDRFYRGTNGQGVEGSGLGLAIVRRVVQRSHGSVRLYNQAGGGLVCHIRFDGVRSGLTPSDVLW